MKLHKTRIELPAATREKIIAVLNQQLANLSDLRTQTKHAHWNVKGPQFWSVHKLFDELAEKVDDAADEIAERLTALGGVANGTVRQAAASTTLAEYPAGAFKDMAAVAAVSDAFGSTANAARKAIDESDKLGDAVTADILTQVVGELDASLYFLEAHLAE
jgi:starvation-inducible DNA-binding protein